jgi:PPOX class probable F420-dependent enzyme
LSQVDRRSLDSPERSFLEGARRAVLATIAPDGQPRLVPICFAVELGDETDERLAIWSPVDQKPKSTDDALALARVRDILARPDVSLLVDRWSESWDQLGWLRLRGRASLASPEHPRHPEIVAALRARYPPYAGHALEARPMLRIVIEAISSWGNLGSIEASR